jgi:hypothetical protein
MGRREQKGLWKAESGDERQNEREGAGAGDGVGTRRLPWDEGCVSATHPWLLRLLADPVESCLTESSDS